MGPNNLCYVTRHFYFFPYVAMSLFIRPWRHFLVFIKAHVGLLQLLKWPCRTSFFTHVEPLQTSNHGKLQVHTSNHGNVDRQATNHHGNRHIQASSHGKLRIQTSNHGNIQTSNYGNLKKQTIYYLTLQFDTVPSEHVHMYRENTFRRNVVCAWISPCS